MIDPNHPLSAEVFVADNATIVGDVRIGPESSVWYGAVLRGDTDSLIVGRQTNLQDHVILHTDQGIVCRIGDRVTVGHGAVIHGSTIHDDCLIGIRATILNHCEIGAGSLIAAGTVLPEGSVIPPRSVVMGVPGKVVRAVAPADTERIQRGWKHYVALSSQNRKAH